MKRAVEGGAQNEGGKKHATSPGLTLPEADDGTAEVYIPAPVRLHKLNRERLVARLASDTAVQDGTVLLLQGGSDKAREETDAELLFRQESFFHWLSGVREPGCYLVMDARTGHTTLFIPRLPASHAVWMGPLHPPEHYAALYGLDHARYVDELPAAFSALAPPMVLVSSGVNSDSGQEAQAASFEGLEAYAVERAGVGGGAGLYYVMSDLRTVKNEEEISLMRHINELASEAHLQLMRRAKVGMVELQLEALFTHWMAFYGGVRHLAYGAIAASGPNSAILHYGHAGAPNDRRIQDGDLVLVDMGGELYCYASDITCTFPANGRFTDQQRVIFETVAAMQAAVLRAMGPGVAWGDMHLLAYRVMAERLVRAGIMRGAVDDIIGANVPSIFMPHGLGHFMGLETHDVGGYGKGEARDPRRGYASLRTNKVLQPGNVITVEPGVYFIDTLLDEALADAALSAFLVPEAIQGYRGTGGVRLEDNVLITASGVENFTRCPRTVEDVEGVMAGTITSRAQLTTVV